MMNIQDIKADFKRFFEDTELFTAFLLVVVALVAFGLGQMSVESMEISKERPQNENGAPAVITALQTETDMYVASKNSNKYHLPWCSGALRIKAENKIVFHSKTEAEEAGYEPAGNCKGI